MTLNPLSVSRSVPYQHYELKVNSQQPETYLEPYQTTMMI